MFSNDSQRRGGVDLAIVDGDLVMLSSPSQGNIAVVEWWTPSKCGECKKPKVSNKALLSLRVGIWV